MFTAYIPQTENQKTYRTIELHGKEEQSNNLSFFVKVTATAKNSKEKKILAAQLSSSTFKQALNDLPIIQSKVRSYSQNLSFLYHNLFSKCIKKK